MKVTGQADGAARVALGTRVFFLGYALREDGHVFGAVAFDKALHQRGFNHLAHLKHFARFFFSGLCHGRAAVGRQRHDLFIRQANQHRAYARAGNAKCRRQTVFDQLGAGRQTVIENGDHNALVNLVFRQRNQVSHGARFAFCRAASNLARPTVKPITRNDTTMVTVPKA